MIEFMIYSQLRAWCFIHTFNEIWVGWGGGGNELSLRFIVLLLHGLLCVVTVMSDYTLD